NSKSSTEKSDELADVKSVDSQASGLVDQDLNERDVPDVIPVSLRRAEISPTGDQALWVAIRNRTKAINFNSYESFINKVLCERDLTVISDILVGSHSSS